MSQAGGDNSSRRLLAELLIQMTELSDNNEDEDGEEYDDVGDYCCDDGDSYSGRSTISTGTGIYQQQPNDILMPSIAMGTQVSAENDDQQQQGVYTPIRGGAGGEGTVDNQQQNQPKPRVIIVAVTNRPEDCDPAVLRRFAVRVLVGLPTKKDRKKIIKRLLSDVEHGITSSQLNELATSTDGWSGSDLESMTREAVMAPIRECLRSAAIAKRKASKLATQKSGDAVDSAQKTDEQKKADDATRDSLLNNFRNLRPVSCKDFEDGIAFFLGAEDFGSPTNKQSHHYDSSSSSSEEEDDADDEDEMENASSQQD